MKYSILLILLLPLLFSCKSKKNVIQSNAPIKDTFYVMNPSTNQLEMHIRDKKTNPDGDWVLQSIDRKHDDEMQRVTLTIKSSTKEFNGNDGCNSYFGVLKNCDDEKIEFADFSKTERECIVPARFADMLYKQLEQVHNFYANDKYLILSDKVISPIKGKGRLQFVRKAD